MAGHRPITFRTAFDTYTSDGVLGQGGAGVVYSVTNDRGELVAIKLLDPTKATTDRMKRFKNEYLFGFANVHPHLLRILDAGIVDRSGKPAPFYVMPRYRSSLRVMMRGGISRDHVL